MNIREGFAKRHYKAVFLHQLNDALGSSEETRGWLSIARDCCYISLGIFEELDREYDVLNAMIYSLTQNWEKKDRIGCYESQAAYLHNEFSDFSFLSSDI